MSIYKIIVNKKIIAKVIFICLFSIFVYMTIAKYISDLLYRYDCVIIPNFGGFVTNEVSAKVNNYTHTFYPPSKQLTFNSNLKSNDGLLASYISSSENISYSKALDHIQQEVKNWNSIIEKEEFELENVGSFSLNEEGNYIFEPTLKVNYLTSSFGLSSFASPAVKRIEYKEKVRQLEAIAPIVPSQNKQRKTPAFIKYAATAAIIFALGTVGWNEYQRDIHSNLVVKAQQEQLKVEKSIQEATFVIENPLPSITLNVTKEIKNYHIIAGAFRDPLNANKKLEQLLEKGFNARILGVNKWNLTQVSYDSFNSKNDAINKLNSIKKSESQEAWLLVKAY